MAIYGLLTAWDLFSSQFGLPTIRSALGVGMETIPVWAYVDMALLLLFVAMFELVMELSRQQLSAETTSQNNVAHEQNGMEEDPAIEPDILFDDVVQQIIASKGKLTRDELARELADKVTSRRMSVWTRSGNRPLSLMTRHDLKRAIFDVSRDELIIYGGYFEPSRFHDIRFLRSEVDQVWPSGT